MSDKIFSYEDVKSSIWQVIKDRADFVYEPASECNACKDRSDWEFEGHEMFSEEPEKCLEHYEQDACRYFYAFPGGEQTNSEAPACVIGNWFNYEGIHPMDLSAENWESVEGKAIASLLKNDSHLQVDAKGIEFLKNMQLRQDEGMSWGEAFEWSSERADNYVEGGPSGDVPTESS